MPTGKSGSPVNGGPVPRRLELTYKKRRGDPRTRITFKEWNLAPQVTEAAFAKEVPAGYEGIAMIQRASVLLNMPENPSGDTATAPGKTGEARRQRTRQATAWDGHLGHDLKKLEISRGNFCSISVLSSPDKS